MGRGGGIKVDGGNRQAFNQEEVRLGEGESPWKRVEKTMELEI